MHRKIRCVADTYITNKYIAGTSVRDANVGQAGTLDLFKLYNETYVSGVNPVIENSRILLKFDLDPLREMTGSYLDLNDSSFRCFLTLNNIYGGQTVPSNFSVSLFPLAKPFDEGRGMDVVAYRDIDTANWNSCSSGIGWSGAGASISGVLGITGSDYFDYGGSWAGFLGVSQSFQRGDENLHLDITTLVSGVLTGHLPDYGFVLGFSGSQETDSVTRFVKRFASRHTKNPNLHPKVEALFDSSMTDFTLASYFDYPCTIHVFNTVFSEDRNFFSGSTEITGENCLKLTLVASKSLSYLTTSFSDTHKMDVTYKTSSFSYFSQSFNASQFQIGGNYQPGIYVAEFFLSSSNQDLSNILQQGNDLSFQPLWQSNDLSYTFTSGSCFKVKRIVGDHSNVAERNFVMTVTNLKDYYNTSEIARLRLFIQDFNTQLRYNKIPLEPTGEVFKNVHYRVLQAFTREVLVPFDFDFNSTKVSSDGHGMYFDIYMEDFEANQVYELEFVVRENNQDYYVFNQGFRFKLIP